MRLHLRRHTLWREPCSENTGTASWLRPLAAHETTLLPAEPQPLDAEDDGEAILFEEELVEASARKCSFRAR